MPRNPEKAKAYRAAYRSAHREEESAWAKEYRAANREKILAREAGYRAANRDNILIKRRAAYAADPEKFRASAQAGWQKAYAANPEKFCARSRANNNRFRPKIRERAKRRRKEIPEVHIAHNLRSRLHMALNSRGEKAARTLDLLGCSALQLRGYLEAQFKPGMTWKNYGPVWHIDHIRPCASFNLTDPEQQRICFNYKNLQPLFATENFKKGSNFVPQNI